MTVAVEELDFSDLEKKYHVEEPDCLTATIVVDGLPQVPAAKAEKLQKVVAKLFQGATDLLMPTTPDGDTKGYVFLRFPSQTLADAAVTNGNNYRFDKSHTLLVNRLGDIRDVLQVPDIHEDPVVPEHTPRDFLKQWLLDPRDQFLLLKQDDLAIFANNQQDNPSKLHSRPNWTESYATWSPKGNYLATLHKPGVALWGGEQFAKIQRFAHPNVKLIDFSPCDNYLTTWSPEPFKVNDADHHLIVWDINTGKKLRTFPCDPASYQNKDEEKQSQIPWPVFKWSHDEKYIARAKSNGIFIYQVPAMNLLGKEKISVENLKDIAWSPSDNILAYWTPESGNIPARVALVKVPTREVLRSKNLFNLLNVSMHWQSNGDYLLLNITQLKKKTTTSHLEVFRLRERGIPMDVMERKGSESIVQVAFEPQGTKFSLVANDGQKNIVYFYEIITAANAKRLEKMDAAVEIAQLLNHEARGINQVVWSPQGRFCVLGGVRGFSGTLEFWDTESMTMLSTSEHDSCSHVEWDPSGRFVASVASFWHVQTDTGVMIWNVAGQSMQKQTLPVLKQFLWRPRPASLLSEAQKQEIKKNVKKYAVQFEREDESRRNRADQAVVDRRLALWKEWIAFKQSMRERFESQREQREALLGASEVDDGVQEKVEEIVEEVVDEIVEVC